MAGTWNRSRQLLTATLPVNPHKSKRMLRLFTLEDRQAPGDLAMSAIFGPALALGGISDELFSSEHRSGQSSWLMPVEDSTQHPAPQIGTGDLEIQPAPEPTAQRRNVVRVEPASRTVQLEEEFGDTFGVRKDRDLLLISTSTDIVAPEPIPQNDADGDLPLDWPMTFDVQDSMASQVQTQIDQSDIPFRIAQPVASGYTPESFTVSNESSPYTSDLLSPQVESSLAPDSIDAAIVDQQEHRFTPSIQTADVIDREKPDSFSNQSLDFTRSEILVGIRANDPLESLRTFALSDSYSIINPEDSSILLRMSEGVSLMSVGLSDGADPLAAVDHFQAQPWVVWAEPNYIVPQGEGRDWTPNDPQYIDAGQYFHTKSQTDLAWNITKGNPAIVVGVADDGIAFNHPDLAANIWINPNETLDGLDSDNNGYVDDIRGWDFNLNDNNPLPSGNSTHGTHVAGIIAARTNNAVGVAGTAGGDDASGPNTGVRLAGLRWEGPNGWTAEMVAKAYAYAADNDINIVNASYNFDFWVSNGVPNATVNTALNYAYDNGVLLMNSSGNSGQLDAPRAVFSQPLFVASLNSADVRSGFSNYGSYVDVAGHGENILSTVTSSDGTGASYALNSGTSMSTPHAAGVAALIWSQNPTWTRDQVVAQLLGTTDNVDSIPGNVPGTLGTGRVNAFSALTDPLASPVLENTKVNTMNGAISSITVSVPRRLDPNSVVATNFELISDGPDNVFDTADDVSLPVVINDGEPYRIGTNSLNISSADPFPPDRYRLTGISGSSNLRDPFGNSLDGNADGTPGDDFVFEFGGNPQISGQVFEDWNGNGSMDTEDPFISNSKTYLDLNNNAVLDVTQNTPSTNTTPVIVTGPPVTSVINTSGLLGSVAAVTVKVNLTHDYIADMKLDLISPNGTRVSLFSERGGDGDNLVNTVFDDSAAVAIASGSAPFTGSFRPESPLAAINTESPNGNWTLELSDVFSSEDDGTLTNWTLTIWTAEPFATTDQNGYYAFTGLGNDTYTVRHQLPTNWAYTSTSSYSVSISNPNDNYPNKNFGLGKNNRFYGFVYADANANGSHDGGDVPLADRTLFVDINSNGKFDEPSGGSYINSSDLPIPDTNTKVYSSINLSGLTTPITDVNVRVEITHTWVSDLDVFLIAPDGTRVELFTDVGGNGIDFKGTILDDQAAVSITAGTAPFTGSFRPEGLLSALNGKVPTGEWKLELADDTGADVGTLLEWELIVQGDPGDTAAITNSHGQAYFDLAPGSHSIGLVETPGWNNTNPASGFLSVNAAGAPLFQQSFGTIDTPAPALNDVLVNGSTAPATNKTFSRVNALELTFNTTITVDNGAFSLSNGTTTLTNTLGGGISVATTGNTVTLTFTGSSGVDYGSLADGIWTLTTDMTKVSNSSSVAGTGTAVTNHIRRQYGDIDFNGVVDLTDFADFGNTFGLSTEDVGYNAELDFDNNGTIDLTDFAEFGNRFGSSLE